MKRLLVLVLLVPILALTMISCDADMRSNIAGFMGGFGGNVYADAGMIVVNTAQAEAAAATVAAIGTGAGASSTSTAGLGVDLDSAPSADTMLAAQDPIDQKKLKDNLGDAFNSDTQKEKLLKDLKKPASTEQKAAAEGTREVFNATLDALKVKLDTGGTDLGDTLKKLELPEIGDNPTQGDMLILQLMTDLISNTVAALDRIGGDDGLDGVDGDALGKEENRTDILSIVDDTLFAAEVAAQISGAASIDFSGQLDLGSILDSFNDDDDKGSRSRGDFKLSDAEAYIGSINGLSPSIISLMGVTYTTDPVDKYVYAYDENVYKIFLRNQRMYRASIEQSLMMLNYVTLTKDEKELLETSLDTATLVQYALAVLVTEHHDFLNSEETDIKIHEIVELYLNDSPGNRKLGIPKNPKDKNDPNKLTSAETLTQPEFDSVNYDNWPAFMKTRGTDNGFSYYKAILENIIEINRLGGIAQLTEQLEDFRDNTTDGFDSWFDGLND